jgi:hypothetical protein
MVRCIESNGLITSVVKLDGILELLFTSDATFIAQYILHGTDTNDTDAMDHAREAAAGQPVVSLGLEMFLGEDQGLLEVRSNGAIGSTLAFKCDGRDFEDLPAYNGNSHRGPALASNIASDPVGSPCTVTANSTLAWHTRRSGTIEDYPKCEGPDCQLRN